MTAPFYISRWLCTLLLLLCGWREAATGAEVQTPGKPNVLIILADDMGFSDAGCYGGEIATPNLDALAQGGLRFSQFYNTARCWPSRAALLTGYYAQQVRRDTVPGVVSGTKGTRPAWARLLPERLREQGYRTYHSGKWHVDGKPLSTGFDHSYSLEDHDRNFTPRRHTQDDLPLPSVRPDANYYTSTAMADHAIQCLREHAEKYRDRPFFSYLAFTSPHFPLQAPAMDIARYREKYLRGWDLLREERWQRQQTAGLVLPLSPVERELEPPYAFPAALAKLGPNEVNRAVPWQDLTPAQREFQANKMAIHAAMVDRMDQEIGRVMAQIKTMEAWENTLIVFLSDNGASAEMMIRGDGHDPEAAPGSAGSFLCLGPGWSNVANTPFRRHKTWVHEGGISTPFIAHWPRGIAARGDWRHAPSHLIDLVPTVLEVAGGAIPTEWQGQSVPPAPGLSLVPEFAKEGAVQHSSIWWQHEGNRALRAGNWKIVAAGERSEWELYDLARDRAEAHNLAAEQPARLKELTELWHAQTEEYRALARRESSSSKSPAPPSSTHE